MRRLLLALTLCLPGLSWADWAADRDGSAGYVTVTTLATAVDEAVPLFVVYLSDLPADFHTAMTTASDTDGKTIRVSTSDGATQIACYPVGVNTGTDTGALFVKGTGMSASADVDYRIYVGNSALSMPAASDTYGRNAVFADYAGFYLPGVTLTDLTGNGRDLTAVNSPGTTAAYEGIDAATYNGSNQYHKYEGTAAVTNWPVTLEGLFYSTVDTANDIWFALADSVDTDPLGVLRTQGASAGDYLTAYFRGTTGSLSAPATSTGFVINTWHYGAASRDANTGTSTVYIGGASSGTSATTITAPSFDRTAIGALFRSSAADYFTGNVAAAYLSSSARSADYVATMHDVWAGTVYSAGAWTANDTCSDGSTGWLLFQTSANVAGGDTAWTNTTNALDDDGDYASVTLSNEDMSDYLTLTNPAGVDIPADATITAVHFRVKRQDVSNDVRDFDIKAVKASSRVGNNLAVVGNWPATAATQDYGGTLLGTTWTPTDFGANFGLAIQILDTDAGSDTGRVYVAWCKIDWVCGDDAAAAARGFFLLAD